MFGNAPREVWKKWFTPDELGRIKLATRGLLIEIGSVKILCETGVGAFFEQKLAQRFGIYEKEHVLLSSLAELDVST